MSGLKSKRWIALIVSLALIVTVVGTGFAFSRGYLMRFFYEGIELSRDQYLALADESLESGVDVYCGVPAMTLAKGYRVHCFDTQQEVTVFMEQEDG